jgi:hypothetical protein
VIARQTERTTLKIANFKVYTMLPMPKRCLRLSLVGTVAQFILMYLAPLSGQADRLTKAPDGSFSFVLIPDTQAYRGTGTKSQPDSPAPVTNEIFAAHTQWIENNIERQRIAFVSHVGDIVDKDRDDQWTVARECIDRLHGRIPYGISVGNHDMSSDGDSSLFQKYFPASRFESFEWYAGYFPGSTFGPFISGNNANSYQLFHVAGLDIVFLHLECNAPDDVLEWANSVLKQHADRYAFITSHMGWGPKIKPRDNEEYIHSEKGRMTWSKIHGDRGNTPQQMWEKCYRHHANLMAVFSGDQSRTQAFHASTVGVQGNEIHELLQDYGSGWLRLYRFHPGESSVSVDAITFDPRTEQLCDGVSLVPDRSAHQFTFEFARH